MTELVDVLPDLNAEAREIDRLVAELPIERWSTPASAPGWSVALHVAHLAATFRMVGMAAGDPAAFAAMTSRLTPGFEASVRAARSGYLLEPPGGLYPRWRMEWEKADEALSGLANGDTVAWLGTDLPAGELASATMVELFAHGEEIAGALGVTRERTDRLRHLVAHGVRTWLVAFRFEVAAPSGGTWTFGPAESGQVVRGRAEDFALLVSGRHEDRALELTAEGEQAAHWLETVVAPGGSASGLLLAS